jgi:uncharacterized membrane protein
MLVSLLALVAVAILIIQVVNARDAARAAITALRGELEGLRRRVEYLEAAARKVAPDEPAPVPSQSFQVRDDSRAVERSAAVAPPVHTRPGEFRTDAPQAVPEPASRQRSWTEHLPGWIHRLMGANTLVRTGVLVLFFGVAFLLKWVTERVTFPIQARLAAAALGGLAMVGLGWRMRKDRPGYGLSLQGGGVGLFYLAIYAAAKIYDLLPLPVALALMLTIVAVAAALAIAQDALALAILGATGGFLAPLLTSTGAGDYRLLLGYYVLLNAGILALAFARSWRPLNLLGFAFTFPFLIVGLGGYFDHAHFWGSAPFLWALFAMYVAIAILHARHRSLALLHYVDGTIVFGTPMLVAVLQQNLLAGVEHGMAIACVVFGALYLVLAWAVGRERIVPSMKLLAEAFLAIGIVFLTLAIPLYFGARATSALWSLEGAAILWVSVRQHRVLGQACGVLLQLLAGAWFAYALGTPAGWDDVDANLALTAPAMPVLNTDFLGFLVLAVAGLFVARQLLRSENDAAVRFISPTCFWWAVFWLVAGVVNEVTRFVPDRYVVPSLLVCAALGTAMLLWTSRRLDWRVAMYPAFALLPSMLLALIAGAFTQHPFAHGGVLAWTLALPVQYGFIAWLDRDERLPAKVAKIEHVATFLLAVALVQVEAHWLGSTVMELATATLGCVYLGLLALALLKATLGTRFGLWPFRAHPGAYLLGVGFVLVIAMALALIAMNIVSDGTTGMATYLPLINPIDFVSIVSLAALLVWQRTVWDAGLSLPYTRRQAGIAFGAGLFFVTNCVLLRALHHWAGTPWGEGMLHSTLVQTVLTVFWTVLSVGAMALAARGGRRVLWLTGAGLLGVVVVKLFFFDLGNLRGLERIVAFLVVGLLLLGVGYFAPVPPRGREGHPVHASR